MPSWIAKCPICEETFTYVEIETAMIEQANRDTFQLLPKPPIPQTGEKRSCPNCKKESVFYLHHLFYREDARGQTA